LQNLVKATSPKLDRLVTSVEEANALTAALSSPNVTCFLVFLEVAALLPQKQQK